ncbi:hypothetical protein GYB62_00465 [bacterium]|nr:hypothetical protein [bacterium]
MQRYAYGFDMLVSFRVSFHYCLPLVLTSLFFVTEASAIEKFAQLGFVVEHSDNALRSETSPRSDLEQRTELALQLAERSRVLSGLLDYRLDYSDYRRETIEDGESIEGRAELVWHMLPERLNWSVSNVSDDLIRDTRGADTRSNRELRNIFSTGPSLYFAPSRVDDVQIDAEFTRSNFEESTTQDSERLAGQAIWSHRTPYRIRTQLGYRYDEVDYLDSPVQNITGQTVFVGIERPIARGEYMIRLGYNQFDVSNRDDVEGTLAEFNLLYSLPGAHSL